MSRTWLSLIIMLFFVSTLGGCVAKGDYLKKEAEANALTEQVANLSKDKEKLTQERNDLDKLLKAKSDDLTKANNDLRFRNADLEAQNYDATSLVLDALAKSKSPAKPDVAEALMKAEITGLRGHQKFREEDHTIPNLTFVIAQIQNGKYVAVWPSSANTGKLLR